MRQWANSRRNKKNNPDNDGDAASSAASPSDESNALYKIILLGDSAVGKSNILLQFIRGTFIVDSKPTIGVEFFSKVVQVENNELVKTQIWDTAGQERYQLIATSYYRRAVGAIIVYDVTRRKSFDHIPKWMKVVEENAEPGCRFMLLGNKTDLEQKREVSYRDGHEFAVNNGIKFFETSALDTTNVAKAFQQMTQEIHDYKRSKKEEEVLAVGGNWKGKGRVDDNAEEQRRPFVLRRNGFGRDHDDDEEMEQQRRRCCKVQ